MSRCISCKRGENGLAEISDGKLVSWALKDDLRRFAAEATDSSSLVTLRLFETEKPDRSLASLPRTLCIFLELHAGANVGDPDWIQSLSNVNVLEWTLALTMNTRSPTLRTKSRFSR